jgi:type II secretion system protein H
MPIPARSGGAGDCSSSNSSGFTLIEIVIVVVISMMMLLLAVPSLTGVLADRRLRRSLDKFNALVRQAQEHSVAEHRAYLIVWADKGAYLRPEALAKDEDDTPTAFFPLEHGGKLALSLPAALRNNPPPEWIFWASGICEPAIVEFKGRDGEWKASYSPLTARAELLNYVAR